MKKIFSIIGSPVTKKSNTKTMVMDFLDSFKEYYNDFESEIIMFGEKNIKYCNGCWACTKTGECPINDDLNEIKEKLIHADLLIFGTPVYDHNVSAQTKTLFDRLFIWMHIQKLIGKPFLTAITTGASGLKKTENILTNLAVYLGAIPIGHLRGKAFRPGEFPERESVKISNKKTAKKAGMILSSKKKIKPGFYNNWIFTGMKYKAKYCKDLLPFEYNYWDKKGWFRMNYKKAINTL